MKFVSSLAIALSLVLPLSASAQHEHAEPGADHVGSDSVSFMTSCEPALRQDFNRAVALLHSFWFAQAIAAFDGVSAKDPSCAIAHWGVALSRWGNPFAGLRSPQQIELGRAAIQRALDTGSPTPRERAYIAAAAELFTSGDSSTQRARTVAYEQGMERVVREFPGDMEARIFYALAVNQTALPSDKKYVQQLKAAAILEPLFKEHPKHPGLAHYIIHAYDHPPLAEKALDAARSYASLAPSVPHALHMPSHTFTRVGLWKESIETNRRSAEAAHKENATAEELHAMDYLAYAYLQTAKDRDARRVVDDSRAAFKRLDVNAAGAAAPGVAGVYATAAIPARYALERGAWAEAASLPVRKSTFPHTDAIAHFARALGAARSGHPNAAAADVEALASLRDALKTMQDVYWAEQVDIQRQIAIAWITFAEGDKARGIELLRAAAAAEDATDKSAVSPGPLAPARELLGYMLLEAERPAEALVEFEATIKKEPNRFRGLYGGARAAEAAGQRARAIALYRLLLQVASEPDTNRPELQHAHAFVQ
jgi:tetratricopeptide (TPR) repeat protein